MLLLRETSYKAAPWKNGGGVTREIHREPADSAPFDWRLSLATIGCSGPFSDFAGYERTLVLVRGAGVELDFGAHGHSRLAAVGQSVSFDGAWPARCTLLEGPSTDFNLIVSRERAEWAARCERLSAEVLVDTRSWRETFICCLHGAVEVTNTSGDTGLLGAVDTVRCLATDGVLTCRPREPAPAQVFIASLRSRPGR